MCAPSSVGAIEPVGMTNASTMNARKTKARMKATRIDSSVSLMLLSLTCGRAEVGCGCVMRQGMLREVCGWAKRGNHQTIATTSGETLFSTVFMLGRRSLMGISRLVEDVATMQ